MCVTQWGLGMGCLVVGVLLCATSGSTLALSRLLFKIAGGLGTATGIGLCVLGINLIGHALA